MNLKNLFVFLVVGALGFSLSSCVSLVKKPAVDKVKTVALVSVTGAQNLTNIETNRPYTTSALSAVTSMVKEKDILALPPEVQAAYKAARGLTDGTVDLVMGELGQVKGWTPKHPREFINNPAYGTFKQNVERIWRFHQGEGTGNISAFDDTMAFLPNLGVVFKAEREVAATRRQMAELCKALGVDGVALAHVTPYFELNKRLIGSSGIVPSVRMQIMVYNSDGDIAVDVGTYYGEADEVDVTTSLLQGFTFDGPPTEAYLSAAKGAAEGFRDMVNKEL